MKFKRGQAALEYLVTYGWTILVLVAILATLYSMGIFRPGNYMPQQCVFQPGAPCTKFILTQEQHGYDLNFTVSNGLGFEMRVEQVNVTVDGIGLPGSNTFSSTVCRPGNIICEITTNGFSPPATPIRPGEDVKIVARILENQAAPSVGTLENIRVSIAYKNCETDPDRKDPTVLRTDPAYCDQGSYHVLSGRITASVEPG